MFLTPTQKLIHRLVCRENRSQKEVAQLTEKSEANVSQILKRARMRLLDAYEKTGDAEFVAAVARN